MIEGDDLRDVLKSIISNYSERFVIFVDEIDWLTDVEFKDDFFSIIRFLFNLRADDASFQKVQFVLSGAALPTELISKENVSPFNIGTPIELSDLSQQQVAQMVELLSDDARRVAKEVSARIYEYTCGSVYLSQLVLDKLWELSVGGVISVAMVDDVVKRIIENASQNVHFVNIRRAITSSTEILQAYRDLALGRTLSDGSHAYLQMTGMTGEQRLFRNLIYQRVFGENGPLSLARATAKAPVGVHNLIDRISNYFLMFNRTDRYEIGIEFFSPEIISRSTRYYIDPYCTSVDPAFEAEMRNVLVTKESIFHLMDELLGRHQLSRHILLLADSGMGKSSFVLNYYIRNKRKRKSKRQRLAIVPLGIPYSDEYIVGISNKQATVLFLDGFDEDPKAIVDHRKRLHELMRLCTEFSQIIITCRTQFFPRDEEIPLETGIARIGPRMAGESAKYQFWKLYLSPLDDAQVEKFIKKRYPFWQPMKRKGARLLVQKIPLLSVRPMLLAYVPDLLESKQSIQYSFQLYEIMVNAWIQRERPWVNSQALRSFSERLAVDLYTNRYQRGGEFIPKDELVPLAKAWSINLDDWQLRGRSLLNRDALGNYKFAHRSIMEYLYVKRTIDTRESLSGIQFTEQMKVFLLEISNYQLRTRGTISSKISQDELTEIVTAV